MGVSPARATLYRRVRPSTPESARLRIEDALHDAAPTLSDRPPAASVIAECLRAQALAQPRTAAARFFGRTPLTAASLPWYLGALGELEVAQRLDSLGPGWRVLHAVPVGRGSSDIDHVVIGPPGVFTINTKHHEGKDVWVASRRILVSGQRTDYLRNARHEASRASQRLSVALRGKVDVTPIIAIVGARRIIIRERPGDVFVLRERQVAGWLKRLPVTIAPTDVSRLADAAEIPSTWHRAPDLDIVDMPGFMALREDVVRSRNRRRGWVAAIVLAAPIVIILAFNSLLANLASMAV